MTGEDTRIFGFRLGGRKSPGKSVSVRYDTFFVCFDQHNVKTETSQRSRRWDNSGLEELCKQGNVLSLGTWAIKGVNEYVLHGFKTREHYWCYVEARKLSGSRRLKGSKIRTGRTEDKTVKWKGNGGPRESGVRFWKRM